MTSAAAQRRYIATEAAIGASISAVLSILFVLLLFGGMAQVPVRGLLVDALPQGFAIAVMATLVPTLLARRRLARGVVTPITQDPSARSRGLMPRALLAGSSAAAVGTLLTAILVPMGIATLPLSIVLIGKGAWGFMLGGFVAAAMTRVALAGG